MSVSADRPAAHRGREARAALLARMFGDAGAPGHIDAIYVSPALRNRLTAAPLAARLGLTPTVAAADDPGLWRAGCCGNTAAAEFWWWDISDTVPDIVAALSGVEVIPPMGDRRIRHHVHRHGAADRARQPIAD